MIPNISKNKTIPADLIADYFIWKSNQEGKKISNKKLQKLLYYAQAWHLVFKNRPLFKEDIEAWIHGPTIRNIYFKYKDLGFNPIDKKIDDDIGDQLKNKKKFLNEVWRVYGRFDADYLEALTHNEAPWQEAREGLESHIASNNVISRNLMKNYYLKRLKEARS